MTGQILIALVIEAVGLHLSAQAGHLSPELGLVEHQQQLALAHPISLTHQQSLNAAPRLGRQIHLLLCLQGADGVKTGLKFGSFQALALHHRQPRGWLAALLTPHNQGRGHRRENQ